MASYERPETELPGVLSFKSKGRLARENKAAPAQAGGSFEGPSNRFLRKNRTDVVEGLQFRAVVHLRFLF